MTLINYAAVGSDQPIDGYTPFEARNNAKGEPGELDVREFAIAADAGSDGIMVKGTPTELREWLKRAGYQLDEAEQRWTEQLAAAGKDGTLVDCTVDECGALAGEPCEHPYCLGRVNPSAVDTVDGEDLDAVLRFEDFAEDMGAIKADDRSTCHGCKAWATAEHLASEQHTQG